MGDSQITKDRIPLKLTHCLMAQTALRPQIMFRAATARLPPKRYHAAAVERTTHAAP